MAGSTSMPQTGSCTNEPVREIECSLCVSMPPAYPMGYMSKGLIGRRAFTGSIKELSEGRARR